MLLEVYTPVLYDSISFLASMSRTNNFPKENIPRPSPQSRHARSSPSAAAPGATRPRSAPLMTSFRASTLPSPLGFASAASSAATPVWAHDASPSQHSEHTPGLRRKPVPSRLCRPNYRAFSPLATSTVQTCSSTPPPLLADKDEASDRHLSWRIKTRRAIDSPTSLGG